MIVYYPAAMEQGGGDFENVVTLPGLFLDNNAGKLNGNTATWSFKRDQLELMDYDMHAESRVVNTWAFHCFRSGRCRIPYPPSSPALPVEEEPVSLRSRNYGAHMK